MVIKRVKTEIFQQEYETRGSYPSLFDCSDGNRYVVKHSQQERNYRHLINEFVASQLSQLVNISTPEPAFIEIKQNILPNDYKYSSGKPSGLGFGSQFLFGTVKSVTNVEFIINLTKHKNDEIVEDLIKICAFDIWLRNADRVINNPNLLVQEVGKRIRLFAIDHSSIFSELNYLVIEKEIDELPSVGENLIDGELFSHLYYRYGLFFGKVKKEICRAILNVSEMDIENIIDNIPIEWKISIEEKKAISNFINKRKSTVESQFEFLLNEIGL
ncbi:MAG: hypothetical protein FD143_1310 [Ignavibacteria bacterium]|nr:MAG: hypothetical protein FD143_1310 [Ignavibacteria bacterium]KAF0160829.1 MAG: hypothetical protein FD188_1434 [Ignavibacteria bacterium]